jgi:glycosyltransferase involved in cell wall biosynthesis
MNPKVSVIIPTYNRSADVQNAIKSVLCQTFTDFEVIVVDDGSSDDTRKVLAKTFGDRIRYHFQTNQGLSGALNTGLAEARGEWVAFLDSDDLWEKEKLEWQFKAIEKVSPPCGACYTDVRFFNYPETRTMFQLAQGEDRHEGMMGASTNVLKMVVRPGGGGMVVCICSVLARTDLVRKSGGFDTNLRFGMDSDFLFRLARLTGFCYVNRPLVLVDRSPAEQRHLGVSSEWNKLEFVLRQTQIRFEKFLRQSESLPTKMRKIILAGLGSVHSGLANCHLEAGEYGKAREAVSRAAQLDLTFNIAVKWLLTWISPRLALRAVQRHQQRTKDLVPFV